MDTNTNNLRSDGDWISNAYTKIGDPLSKREMTVLCFIAQGETSETIGEQLGISKRTVEVYRTRIMQKLNARTAPHAVAIAYECGILERNSMLVVTE
jgi:DNA-binding CsgD family transcriptional regulator